MARVAAGELRLPPVGAEHGRPPGGEGTTQFYVISFNHRLAFVKASDVNVVG
jgi:hypothetical protein